MMIDSDFLAALLFLGALAVLFLAAAAWRRRSVPGALFYALLLLCVALYTAGYGFEISSPRLEDKLFWTHFQYLGIAFIPVFWIFFIFDYTGHRKWLSGKWPAAWLVMPLLTVALKLTDSRHGLVYSRVFLDESAGFSALSFTRGPWYVIFNTWVILVLALGLVILFARLGNVASIYRRQVIVVATGALIPFAAYLFHWFSGFYLPIDIIPAGFLVGGLVVITGIYRYHFLNLAPVVRHALIEHSRDGFMVLDEAGRVIDINPVMTDFFGLPGKQVLGREMTAAFRDFPDISALERPPGEAGGEKSVTLEAPGGRFVSARLVPLVSGDPRPPVRLVVVQDVTRRVLAERELLVEQSFRAVMVRLATEFINMPSGKFEQHAQRALAAAGSFCRADRAYLFNHDPRTRTLRNTVEWCAPGIEPQISLLQKLVAADFPSLMAAHLAGQDFLVPDVAGLTDNFLRSFLEKQGIRSLVLIPMFGDGEYLGFVGFDHVREKIVPSEKEVKLLRVLCSILAGAQARLRGEKALRESERRYDLFLESAPLGIAHLDTGGRLIRVNDRLSAMIGGRSRIIPGRFFPELVSPSRFEDIAREIIDGREGSHECRFTSPESGREFFLEVCGRRFGEGDDENRGGVMLIVHDITEIREAEDQLRRNALHDSLTGLPNRNLLYDRMNRAIQRLRREPGEGFLLFFIDLDDFKVVNDRFGHAAGDALIREAAARVSACLRPEDLAARLSGDEFAVFIENIPGPGYESKIALRLLREMALPYLVDDTSLEITASIGVCRNQPGVTDAEAYLHDADMAMYLAKRNGKNRFAIHGRPETITAGPESPRPAAAGETPGKKISRAVDERNEGEKNG